MRQLEGIVTRDRLILLALVFVYLILIAPDLLPTIHSILPDDEAKYIDSGRSLVGLEIRQLAWGPIVAALYAPLHVIFGSSPNWFLQEAWVGRIMQFGLLWFSTLYLASKYREHVNLYIVVGVLYVSVAFLFVVKNQSDVLFSSFSAIALAQLLAFQANQRLRDVWIGSAVLGLAGLARIDALLWIALFMLVSLGIGFRTFSIGRILIAAGVPAIAILAGFVAISLLKTGGFEHSIGSLAPKLYLAFEQNQSVLTGGDDAAAYSQARELFGTQEENDGSIFRAIFNKPSAFFQRIAENVKNIPEIYFSAFDKLDGLLLALFAVLGVAALIRTDAYLLLAISILWALPSAYYLGFLSRHVVSTLAYLPVVFASIGITYAFRRDIPRIEQLTYLAAGFLLIALSLIGEKPAFLASGIVLTSVLALTMLMWPRIKNSNYGFAIALFVLLIGGLVLREPYKFPNLGTIGDSPDERGIQFIQELLPRGSKVAVPNSNFAIAAVMDGFPILEVPPIESPERLHNWFESQDIKAVYVQTAYIGESSQVQTVMRQGLDRFFDVGFSEGPVEIVLVRESSKND